MNHILVPIGNSPDIHETLQYAVDFAAPLQSKIFVMEGFVNVWTASYGNENMIHNEMLGIFRIRY